MVSTRSNRPTFTEGERVLCYEPDPLKTRVLYNSKVLGICLKQDQDGNKVSQFLIHFQGWNSTWDRFVTEEFVLKDTEENRKLQRDLAADAQLKASANLYRRGRKKRTLSRTGSDNDRRGAESDSDGESNGLTYITQRLQNILEFDWEQITNKNKLLKVPCSPNALEILHLWMKEYAISQIRLMCHKRGNLRPTAGKNSHITVEEILTRANLCHEIADGLRIYLDIMLADQLLYPHERAQYMDVSKAPLPHQAKKRQYADELIQDAKFLSPLSETDRRKSLRSHSDTSQPNGINPHTPLGNINLPGPSQAQTLPMEIRAITPRHEVPLEQMSEDLASVLGQDVVKGGEHLMLRPITLKEKLVLKRIVHRTLVPPSFNRHHPTEGNPFPACLLFGAVHLCRALVKLPDVLPQGNNYSDAKMNVINDYLHLFAKFLEDHADWFGENMYCDNTYAQEAAGSL